MRSAPVGDFKATKAMFDNINEVLVSGQISYGRYSREFEQRFAALHGCEYGVLSNSGTDALRISLQVMREMHGWPDGYEVIVPALTFVATVNIVLHNRLTPVLVDIEPEHYGIDASRIEAAITPKTRAILPVHLFGHPCNMPAIVAIAHQYNLKIIEDSCEIAFASIGGKSVSSWGDVGCHSFYMAHIITTGVGGISLTNDPGYARKIRSLSNHGLTYQELSKAGETYDPALLSRFFLFDSVGNSARLTEFESALGVAQLDDYANNRTQRLENFHYYNEHLRPLAEKGYLKLPQVPHGAQSCPMMYPVAILVEPKHRLMKYLDKHGIGVRDTVPLTNQPVYAERFRENDYPYAKFMNRHGLYWGCHPYLTPEDRAYVVATVHDYFTLYYGKQS